MDFFTALWLPMLLSAVFVFVASSIIHMLIPIHRNDAKALPDEEGFSDNLNDQNLAPGEYFFPACKSMKDMGSEEMMVKYRRGPVGFLILSPKGPPAMGKLLGQWFAYCWVVSFFTGYIAYLALGKGADYEHAFRVSGSIAVSIYALGSVPNSIWKGVPWSNTVKFLFDGVVYGLITAGTFGWLWPST